MKSFIKVIDSDYLIKDNGITICTLKYNIQINKLPPTIRWVFRNHPKIMDRFIEDRFSVATVKCHAEDNYDEKIGKKKAFIKALSMAHKRFLEEDINKIDKIITVMSKEIDNLYQVNVNRSIVLDDKLNK